ncbi:MAG: RDD family protein [Sphingobacteriales bacterium]|nr:RDD family protein [Sphingobacteriales bacterium]
MAVIWLYFAEWKSSKFQGTLSKLAVGLKVTDLNGNGISFCGHPARYFCGMLMGYCYGRFVIAAIPTKQLSTIYWQVLWCLNAHL